MPDKRQPYVLDEGISYYLHKFAKCLVPKRRKILLVFDLFETKCVNPNIKPIGGDVQSPPYFILLAIRTIVDYMYQPVGAIFFYEKTLPEKIARCIRAFIADLTDCSFNIIASISSTKKKLIPIVHSLVQISASFRFNDIHFYDVDNVKKIVHIYDSSSLLQDLQEVFFNSCIYFLYKDNKYIANCREILTDKETVAYGILKEVMQVDAKERNLSMALKIFSEATAVEMKLNGNPETQDCVQFLLLIDQLYDSLNAYETYSPKYRRNIRKNSKHFQLWFNAIYAFDMMTVLPFTPPEETKQSKKVDKQKGTKEKNKKKEPEKPMSSNEKIYEYANRLTIQNLLRGIKKYHESINDFNITMSCTRPMVLEQWSATLKGVKYLCEKLMERYESIETKHFSIDVLQKCILQMKFNKTIQKKQAAVVGGPPQTRIVNEGYLQFAFETGSCVTLY